MEDWKRKLVELGAKVSKGKEPVASLKTVVPHEKIVKAEVQSTDPVHEAEMSEKNGDETNSDFVILVSELGLKKGSNRYYSVRDLFYYARRTDIDYDLNRWIGYEGRLDGGKPIVVAIVNKLKKEGYASFAYMAWKSAKPENMRYGKPTITKEMRLAEAQKFADQAGVPLDEIIRQQSSK